MSIYKDCDIRGVVGKELDIFEAFVIGRAVGMLTEGKPCVIGGDFRVDTMLLKRRFILGMAQSGGNIIDVGQLPTPALYYAKNKLGCYGAVQVTASHNPPEYNGFKVMFGQLPVLPSDIEKIKKIVTNAVFVDGKWKYERVDIIADYCNFVMGAYSAPTQPKGFKIVIDAGNGTMGKIAPLVFTKLGFDVVKLFCKIDGRFPDRDPNPAVIENISALCAAVVEQKANLGVAFDGDGDRAIFVDHKGVPLSAEEAVCIFAGNALKDTQSSVVYDIKSSSILPNEIARLGSKPIAERSGHAFIKRTFLKNNSALAGEVSGHYFFDKVGGDDGLYAAVLLCSILVETGKNTRQLLKHISYPQITPDIRVKCTPEEAEHAYETFNTWAKQYNVSTIDGIKATKPDGSWALFRRSVTEPAVTLRLEAPNKQILDKLKLEILALKITDKI